MMDDQAFELLMKRLDAQDDMHAEHKKQLQEILNWKTQLSTRLTVITTIASTVGGSIISFIVQMFVTKVGK